MTWVEIAIYWGLGYIIIGILFTLADSLYKLRKAYKMYDSDDDLEMEDCFHDVFHDGLGNFIAIIFLWPLFILYIGAKTLEYFETSRFFSKLFIKILKKIHKDKNPEKYL